MRRTRGGGAARPLFRRLRRNVGAAMSAAASR